MANWALLTGQMMDDEKEKEKKKAPNPAPDFPPKHDAPHGEGGGDGGGGDDLSDLLDDGPSSHHDPLDSSPDGPGGGGLDDLLDGPSHGGHEDVRLDMSEVQKIREGVHALMKSTDDPTERVMLEQLVNKLETLPDEVVMSGDPASKPGKMDLPEDPLAEGPGGPEKPKPPAPMGGPADKPVPPMGGPSKKPSPAGLDALAFITGKPTRR